MLRLLAAQEETAPPHPFRAGLSLTLAAAVVAVLPFQQAVQAVQAAAVREGQPQPEQMARPIQVAVVVALMEAQPLQTVFKPAQAAPASSSSSTPYPYSQS